MNGETVKKVPGVHIFRCGRRGVKRTFIVELRSF